MTDYKALAELLYPDVKYTPEELEQKYGPRNLPEGARVTRFAPSPTGFVHFGSLYISLIDQRVAHQSQGVYMLRIEDTDKKREIEGGVANIVDSLANFGINADEGVARTGEEIGNYGPYKQSERMEIYKTFAKLLVEKGYAYPCFCSEEELDKNRKSQEEVKLRPGYYGEWAVHRNSTLDEVKAELETGKRFVLRIKSPGDADTRIVLHDLIKGDIEMPENDQDMVLIKSDGLPTYHFAHAVDDHLMKTTHVIRGDEWLSTAPLHLQLFQVYGWELPIYAHISPIMKMEGTSKRKLSKRKDPEAAVSYYHEQGYPKVAVIEYMLNLINSNFEEWRRANPTVLNTEFKIELERMSVSGALFDFVKLTDISKDLIAMMSADEVFELVTEWAEQYDKDFAAYLLRDEAFTRRIFSIERPAEKPRKDFGKWMDVKSYIFYFFDELFEEDIKNGYNFPENISTEDVAAVLKAYREAYDEGDDKQGWFERVKAMCPALGFASEVKAYKKNPQDYKGHVGDVTTVIRVAATNRRNTPDLYEILKVMGSG